MYSINNAEDMDLKTCREVRSKILAVHKKSLLQTLFLKSQQATLSPVSQGFITEQKRQHNWDSYHVSERAVECFPHWNEQTHMREGPLHLNSPFALFSVNNSSRPGKGKAMQWPTVDISPQ